MQIQTNTVRLAGSTGVNPETVRALKPPVEEATFSATASLNAALKAAPEVRQAEIERATKLVETGNYPPPELINRLAKLLADEISQSGSSPSN